MGCFGQEEYHSVTCIHKSCGKNSVGGMGGSREKVTWFSTVLGNFKGFQLNTSGQEATEGALLGEVPQFRLGWFLKGSSGCLF